MADDADRAEERIENTLADALAEVRRKPSLVPCGACIWCGEAVPQHHIFCSMECSEDYTKDQKMRRIAGR